MQPALNLRFDLKRKSDAEIGAYFEAKMAEREAIKLSPWPLASNRADRPIVRHPAIYRATYILRHALSAGIELVPFVFAAFIGFGGFRRWALDSDGAQAYLLNCKLLDVMDEMKRRVARRARVNA